MEAGEAVASPAGNGSDAFLKGLKRCRSIALAATFLVIACGFVCLSLQWSSAGKWMFVLELAPIFYVLWVNRKLRAELAKRTAQGSLPAKDQSILVVIISQVLPPLLMLPLFMFPWDLILIYWIVCGMAALSALSNLSARRVLGWKANLRSLLTVTIFAAAVAAGFAVEAASSRYADELTASLQRACKERGRCLAVPEGWRAQRNLARSNHGHWTFTYVTNVEQSEFGLWVHMHNEVEKCIHGGSTIPLSEIRSLFCNSDPKTPSSRWQYEQKAGGGVDNPRNRL